MAKRARGRGASAPLSNRPERPFCTVSSRTKDMTVASRAEACVRIRRRGCSDIFQFRVFHRAEILEGIDAGVVAIAECDPECIVSDAPDPRDSDVQWHGLRCQDLRAAHLVPASCAGAGKTHVTRRKVLFMAIAP